MTNEYSKNFVYSPHFPHLNPTIPPLTYQDVKHLNVFAYTLNDKNEVACLYVPESVRLKTRLTLEKSLKLFRERPTLFSNPSVIARLYCFIYLYDKSIKEKIEARVTKQEKLREETFKKKPKFYYTSFKT